MEIVECTRVFVHAVFVVVVAADIVVFVSFSAKLLSLLLSIQALFVFAVIVVSFHVVVVVGKVLVYHDSSQLESKILFSKSGMILAHWK